MNNVTGNFPLLDDIKCLRETRDLLWRHPCLHFYQSIHRPECGDVGHPSTRWNNSSCNRETNDETTVSLSQQVLLTASMASQTAWVDQRSICSCTLARLGSQCNATGRRSARPGPETRVSWWSDGSLNRAPPTDQARERRAKRNPETQTSIRTEEKPKNAGFILVNTQKTT